MFGNFIYFIIALLIYSTYQPSEGGHFPPLETFFLFVSLIVLFGAVTWIQFRRLERKIFREPFPLLDNRFHSLLTRQSIMAVVLYAVDIYVLNLTDYGSGLPGISRVPTLQALLFLALFIFYLSIVWACAHGAYRIIYSVDLSKKSYIFSNISYGIPVIFPWFCLSLIADLIQNLPFELPRRLLSTTGGEATFFLVFLVCAAVFGPVLIKHFWGCTPMEGGIDRKRIEELCRRAGFEYANILYWPIFGGRMITAGVMGLVKNFRYVLVTEALLRLLQPEEIDAVIAHEIGHIKRKHLLFYMFFFAGYLLLTYSTFDLIIYGVIYAEPFYRVLTGTGINQVTITSAVFSVAIIVLFLFYFRFVFGYFMRNFERQADAYVFHLFDSALPLISTLDKIALTTGQSRDKPNWHHFSIGERIDYLQKCEADRSWIGRQDRKIRKSIAVYLAAMTTIAAAGYHLSYGEAGKRLSTHFFLKIIEREIEKNPENAELYGMLGDLRYSAGSYRETARAYEKSLSLDPDNAKVLNNLAWLYATAEEQSLRNPERALVLARKAAQRSSEPHVLDTLAESYFVNGYVREAIEAESLALERVKGDRSYYEGQLRKFREKLGAGNRRLETRTSNVEPGTLNLT